MALLYEQTIVIAVGLVIQLLAWLAPLRKQSGERETRWDIIAMMCGVIFASVFTFLIAAPLSRTLATLDPVSQWHERVQAWPLPATWLLYLLLADFLAYWAHRCLHTRRFWNGHAWHHSPRYLWWAAGLRAAPLHVVVLMLPYTLVFLVFPVDATGVALFAMMSFGIANQHWLHSNLRVPFPRQLEWLFVTPRFHFVHHSADMRFTNSNYGFIFSLWDRLFKTYTAPEQVAPDEPLGLDYENSNLRFLLGLPPSRKRPAHTGKERQSGDGDKAVAMAPKPFSTIDH